MKNVKISKTNLFDKHSETKNIERYLDIVISPTDLEVGGGGIFKHQEWNHFFCVYRGQST